MTCDRKKAQKRFFHEIDCVSTCVQFSSFPDFYVLLHVSIPSTAILVRETEEINDRRFLEDRQLLEFNIYELKTFILEYKIPKETNAFQLKLFWSGILIGSGISVIVSVTVLNEIIRLVKAFIKWTKEVRNLTP